MSEVQKKPAHCTLLQVEHPSTDYVHAHVTKVLCRKKWWDPPEVFTDSKSLFPHLHTVLTVAVCLSAPMINESDGVPVFI